MGIHENKPTRNVVHISTCIGPRGGETWVLELDCGHRAYRPVPRIAPDTMVYFFGKLVTAPYRVKCLFCEDGAESSPPMPDCDGVAGDQSPVAGPAETGNRRPMTGDRGEAG